MNRDRLAPATLAAAIDQLRALSQQVRITPNEDVLRKLTDDQIRIIDDLGAAVDAFFFQEGRDAELDWPPQAEIVRKPAGSIDEFSPEPVFIIGHKRSGTTLLLYLLNCSDGISALPETDLAGEVAQCDKLIQLGTSLKRILAEPFPTYLRRLGQLVDAVYRASAERNGKRRWAAKELVIPHRLDVLDAMFDYRARFVYAIRHGFDVAWSCACRFPMRNAIPLSEDASLGVGVYLNEWIRANELTLDFCERNAERCCLVKYEDLVADPVGWGRTLYEFVGERWQSTVLEQMAEQQLSSFMGDNKIYKTRGRIVPSPSVWRDWPRALQASLGRRANPTLERLGYDRVA